MSIANRVGLAATCVLVFACGGSGDSKSVAGSGGTPSSLGGAESSAGETMMASDAAGAGGVESSESAGAPGMDNGGGSMLEGGAPTTGTGGTSVETGGTAMMNAGGAPGDAGGSGLAGTTGNAAGTSGSGGVAGSGGAVGSGGVAGTAGAGTGGTGTGGTGVAGNAGASTGGTAGAGGSVSAGGTAGAGGTQNVGGCQGDLDCASAPVGSCATPFCNKQTGLCEAKSLPDDTGCDDEDACTQKDSCQLGKCVGTSPVICGPSDQCHVAGICNAFTGACSNPKKKDGSICDDGDACTQKDSCGAGACLGTAVVCSALDQCHDAGTCSPKTGLCSDPPSKDGNACDDSHACTVKDQCQAGVCGGSSACKLSIDPDPVTLAPGGGQTFTATLSGVLPNTVSWSIEEGATGGSIGAASGAYVAPGTLSTYHVVATSTADSSVTASVPVTVTLTPVAVSLCPAHATILPDDSLLLTALVSGTGNHAVTWSTSGGTIQPWGGFTPAGAGSYTITAQSVVEPAKKASATIDAVAAVLPNITGAIGYGGAKTGPIRVTIDQGQRAGTALTGPGKYRIRGVDLQTNQSVTVKAYMDTLGTGKYSVGADPYGTFAIASFPGTNVSNVNITLIDPGKVVLSAPGAVIPVAGDGFALVRYQTLHDNSNNELADEYRVYVDTTSAVGPASYLMNVAVRAGAQSVTGFQGLSNGVNYWFAVTAVSAGTEGPKTVAGPVQPGPPVGGHAVSGTIDFTGLAVTGPLYAIAYNGVTQQLYVSSYTPPFGATTQAFSIGGLPDGSFRLGVAIDQDGNGEIGPHDPLTLTNGGNHPFDIAGADLAGENIQVPADRAAGQVTTHYLSNFPAPYNLDFKVNSNTRLPLAAWLSGGPNAPAPADLGVELSDSSPTLRRGLPLFSSVPQQGDKYDLTVMYDDGVTCDLPVSVSGVWGTMPTLLAPVGNGNGSPTPVFSWLPPASAPKYFSYELGLYAVSGQSDIWRFDGPSSTTSVTYNFDGKAKQGTLSPGVGYDWWVDVNDRFGNSARSDSSFSLP